MFGLTMSPRSPDIDAALDRRAQCSDRSAFVPRASEAVTGASRRKVAVEETPRVGLCRITAIVRLTSSDARRIP
jgi:hypothetical protein